MEIPVHSFAAAAGEIDRWFWKKSPELHPMLRFESTEVSRKDASTWSVTGKLDAFGRTVTLYLEPVVRKLHAEQFVLAGIEGREALGFTASFKFRLSELVPNLTQPDSDDFPWTLKIDVLAEAEE